LYNICQEVLDDAHRAGIVYFNSVSIDNKTLFAKRGRVVDPTRFDEEAYKNRGSVEGFNAWIESFKRVMVRFERLKMCFMAVVNLASIKIMLRVLK